MISVLATFHGEGLAFLIGTGALALYFFSQIATAKHVRRRGRDRA